METFITFFKLGVVLLFVLGTVSIPIITIIVVSYTYTKNKEEYEKSSYYQCTKVPYSRRKIGLGQHGEYLTYCCLKVFETAGAKLLFNLYIPKENYETTEIDALMISSKGIYVFESKNYSGWIFGSENKKYWYQTLAAGRNGVHKESFYNPVMQNATHIKHLKNLLSENIPIWSVIVFSDRCTLKSININSKNVYVIKRNNLSNTVIRIREIAGKDTLDENKIVEIYNKLFPYTQVEQTVKLQHIANIKK